MKNGNGRASKPQVPDSADLATASKKPALIRSYTVGGSPMNKLLAVFAISLFSGLSVFSQTTRPLQVTEDAIREMEQLLSTALLKGDAPTVDRIIADDYVEITRQGVLRHKEDVMALVRARASAPRATSIGPEVSVYETKLIVHGEVIVFTGVMKTRYQHMEYQVSTLPNQTPGPDNVDQERFTKVYAKRGSMWQLVASQVTPIVAP